MKRIGISVLLLCALFSIDCYAQKAAAPSALKEFQDFWSEFRAAVKANDKEKIASLTAFPFEIKGQLDDDPVKKYNKAAFLKILDQLLNFGTGLSMDEKMRDFIGRKAEVNSKDLQSDGRTASIGNFAFEKVKGKWAFVEAFGYLEN